MPKLDSQEVSRLNEEAAVFGRSLTSQGRQRTWAAIPCVRLVGPVPKPNDDAARLIPSEQS